MKITAGLGSIEDYVDFVKAGADEVFAGFVPDTWVEEDGLWMPMNRREVCYVNVQLGSESELRILSDRVRDYGVPVTLTLNALYYRPKHYEMIADMIRKLLIMGFDRYIIADPALLVYLKKVGLSEKLHLHVSGEWGEMNRYALRQMESLGAERVIFHRKVALGDMEHMIKHRVLNEYEAFALNEACHFHGGFCNSLHCDQLAHLCLVPYRVGPYHEADQAVTLREAPDAPDMVGASGCGLCSLYRMKKMGITHLKVVGRGNYTEDMIRDIRALRTALEILEKSPSEAMYIREMKETLFPDGCSGICYYMNN